MSFNKVLKRLDFQHKHIGSIAAYNKKYRKALNKYRKNKHLYDTLLPKLNSPYFNSLFNLKSHKSLLIAQNIELKSLLVNEPSKPWFSYLNQNFDLSIILIPIVLVGILYFCLIHWKPSWYVLRRIFLGHTILVFSIWIFSVYDINQTFGESLWSFFKTLFFHLICLRTHISK